MQDFHTASMHLRISRLRKSRLHSRNGGRGHPIHARAD
jgi:hypothetical protein